jgi:peptidoglycan/LPS O-acetylase OafA/YrhL
MTDHRAFRNDINGLRAWAVAAVVLYHFGVSGFSGGFAGVDIFFVISGFLMTGIIVRGLDPGAGNSTRRGFSIIDFYLSRARRIIPALLVLCAVVLVMGWFMFSAREYRALGLHAMSAVTFVSNITFWQEAGYFDGSSHDKLLLHTWSLSVEWQFYLLLPVFLTVLWKLRPSRGFLALAMVAGLVLSLALCVLLTPSKPGVAFYLLPTRAWEMLAGGLVMLLGDRVSASRPVSRTLEALGFALIIATLALYDPQTLWPSWRAVMPVVGTMLILLAARQHSFWTATPVAQWLGNSSYSLYLWHWPLVVVLSYLQWQNNAFAIAGGIALTLILGWASYRWIETPARNSLTRLPRWPGLGAIATPLLAVVVAGSVLYWKDGIPTRLKPSIDAVFNEATNKNPRMKECTVEAAQMLPGQTPIPDCVYGNAQAVGAIILGDSHATSSVSALQKALPGKNVLTWIVHGCPVARGIESNNRAYRCDDFVEWVLKQNAALPANVPIFIVNRFTLYAKGPNEASSALTLATHQTRFGNIDFNDQAFAEKMRQGVLATACELAKVRPVYMIRPTPELMTDVPKNMGRGMILGQPRNVSITLRQYYEREDASLQTLNLAAQQCGVKLLDPLPYLCSGDTCRGDVAGMPIYYDDNHLSERGSALLVPMYKAAIEQAAKANKLQVMSIASPPPTL